MRDQVRQLRDVRARQKRLGNLLVAAYRDLPQANHRDTIPGRGEVAAAILTAFILDSDPQIGDFMRTMAKLNRGRAFFGSGRDLGRYVLHDYVNNKRQRIS